MTQSLDQSRLVGGLLLVWLVCAPAMFVATPCQPVFLTLRDVIWISPSPGGPSYQSSLIKKISWRSSMIRKSTDYILNIPFTLLQPPSAQGHPCPIHVPFLADPRIIFLIRKYFNTYL